MSLQVFNFNQNEVRTFLLNNDPYFCLKDICSVLELSNPSMVAERLDEDERTKFNLGRQGDTTFINESGLYNVVLRSDKPQAKQFRKWVTSEVLPSIRKTGIYATELTVDKMISDPDFAIKLLTNLKEEQNKRKELENKIQEDRSKVVFAESLLISNQSILIGELAKLLNQNGINMGQNRLYQWLRDNKYLITRGEKTSHSIRNEFNAVSDTEENNHKS